MRLGRRCKSCVCNKAARKEPMPAPTGAKKWRLWCRNGHSWIRIVYGLKYDALAE